MADAAHKECGSQDLPKHIRENILRVTDDEFGRPKNPESPILIIEGPQGSQETAELKRIAESLSRITPFARFDFGANPPSSVNPKNPKIHLLNEVDSRLTAFVWDLQQWRPIYGRPRFRRFSIAQVIRRMDLDPERPYHDLRKEVISELRCNQNVDRLEQMLQSAVERALGQAPTSLNWSLSILGPYAVQFIFDWVLSRTIGRYVLLGRSRRWFASQGLGNDIDALLKLNKWRRNDANPSDLENANRLMFAAFFADLQDNFQRGRRHGEWSFNAVLLLENVDSGSGKAFLAELAMAREKHRSQAKDHADPLTVVATSRTHVPVTKTSAAGTPIPDIPITWLLLRPLGFNAISEMVKNRRGGHNHRFLAFRIHKFTGGHPKAVDLLLEAADALGTADPELNALLAWRKAPATDAAEPEKIIESDQANEIRLCLLPAVSGDELEDLITLSAARDRNQAVRLAVTKKLMQSDVQKDPTALAPELWVADDPYGQLLRRLLLRHLSARGPDHLADWSTVHSALRRCCAQPKPPGDNADPVAEKKRRIDELYYALAEGDLRYVVDALATSAICMDTEKWRDDLKSIATAPRHVTDQAPDKQVKELVHKLTDQQVDKIVHKLREHGENIDGETIRALARVIVGEWIDADPATPGNQFRLHKNLASDYREVLQLVMNREPTVIQDEVDRHEKEAEQWR